jgi:type II secretory pathway pseudopilin PulG
MAKGGTTSSGFTIVETLIVLAVSAALAGSMILLVNGRQEKTEFQVAVNSLKTKLQQIINETSNGYYPNNGDFSCTGTSTGPSISSISHASQGTNNTCIFLGKAVQLGIKTGSADANQSFTTYPLVANRYDTTGAEVSTFAAAKPIALSKGSNPYQNVPDYSENFSTQNGLFLVPGGVKYLIIDHAGHASTTQSSYAIFALADQLGQYAATSGDIGSSVQNLDLFKFADPPTTPADSTAIVDDINTKIDDLVIVNSIQLCFSDGSPNRSALITISGQGQLSVTLKVYGTPSC